MGKVERKAKRGADLTRDSGKMTALVESFLG